MVSACSIAKKLPQGTYLYKGATYNIIKDSGDKTKIGPLKKQIKKSTSPIPNKTIFGFPYRVWVWYLIGEPKKQKGFKYWLSVKLGEPPILSTQINTKANAENFQYSLSNKGFFRTKASGDTVVKGSRVIAKYKIKLGFPYKIDTVKWLLDSASEIGQNVFQMAAKENYTKRNQQFNLADIKAERTRTDIFLKTKGYYYFNPDYIFAQIDSTIGNHRVNIFYRLKQDVPVAAVIPQSVQKITVFPNYTLLSPPPDTAKN